MISSLCIIFLIIFYVYFKQYYEKLIAAKLQMDDEKRIWTKKLNRILLTMPAGIIAIVILYAISFTLMSLYPEVENVKSSRRVVDVVAVLFCLALFFWDKKELDKKLGSTKNIEQL
ncbi:hypothetical protein [Mucilaginibacter paludis]|uniref:Uncharacterized protein n=1 Tax=Mucilaginibacter paludis DSM 18603 TaxID=714943 RepID=H1Y9E0_9SPHI|nr:hypothetical protein [Mucilaginibacter paludis]EHQ29945.1 hypothetical protein Mucpa_5879 [Mucilaginibacter paludis DSM 18603]